MYKIRYVIEEYRFAEEDVRLDFELLLIQELQAFKALSFTETFHRAPFNGAVQDNIQHRHLSQQMLVGLLYARAVHLSPLVYATF